MGANVNIVLLLEFGAEGPVRQPEMIPAAVGTSFTLLAAAALSSTDSELSAMLEFRHEAAAVAADAVAAARALPNVAHASVAIAQASGS